MKVTETAKEIKIGSGAFERSSVAWTLDGRIVVVADMGEKPVFYYGEEPVRGSTFVMAPLVDGMAKDPIYANRCFLGRVVVDSRGNKWVSIKTGTKELDKAGKPGTTRGAALIAIRDGEEPDVVMALLDVGHAQAEPNPGGAGAIVLGTLGKWALFNENIEKIGSGTFGQAGDSGEKIQFRVGFKAKKPGVVIWHTCHNGFSGQSSRYACSGNSGSTWASFSKYPQQGGDTAHPGLGVDAKVVSRAYMGYPFDNAMRVNVAYAGTLRYSPDALPSLGAATDEIRFGPQFVPHPKGGMICLWNNKGMIRIANVESVLAGTSGASDLVAGRFASGAIRKNTLVVVYAKSGGLFKREFRLEM